MARQRQNMERPQPSLPPTRGGERWESAECYQLVDELRAGIDLEDIAHTHGRTLGGITARIKLMVPRDEDIPQSRAADWLREALVEGYDWESVLEANVEMDGNRYWRAEYDLALRDGWGANTRLPDLARQVGGDELQVVRRLMTLGLADSLIEVTDRLGYSPDGPVALRRLLALDSSNAAVYVLIVDPPETPKHVSIHSSRAEADRLREVLVEEDARAAYFWQVVLRWPGSGTKGRTWSGSDPDGTGSRAEPF